MFRGRRKEVEEGRGGEGGWKDKKLEVNIYNSILFFFASSYYSHLCSFFFLSYPVNAFFFLINFGNFFIGVTVARVDGEERCLLS